MPYDGFVKTYKLQFNKTFYHEPISKIGRVQGKVWIGEKAKHTRSM